MQKLENYEKSEAKKTYGEKNAELKELEKSYNENIENTIGQYGEQVKEFEKKMKTLSSFRNDILNPGVEKLESENEEGKKLTDEEKKELQNFWTEISNEYEKGGFSEIANTPEKYYINPSKLINFINTISDNQKKVLIKVLNATVETTNNERAKLILDGIEKINQ